MKWHAAYRRATFLAVAGGLAASAVLTGGAAIAAVPVSATSAAIATSTVLYTPDGKQAEVTLTESQIGNGEYSDVVSFSQVSAGITDEVLADSSRLETAAGAVTLLLTDVRTVQAAICDSSGCSPWWP
jgi:hypothetical protein